MRVYYNSATPPSETWVRVSAVVNFPNITTRNNSYGYCNVTLRDFKGDLFATWNPRDLTEMKVTDDAGTPNTIFRGYLMNKRFHDRDLVLDLAGIGILLYRRSFGSEEIKNYILEQGYPKTLNANTQIDLHKSDGEGGFENFTWDDEKWIKGDKDVGIIIKDNTEGFVDNIYWDCNDPIAQAGGAVQGGDFASTITFDDADYYEVKDESTTPDLVITATMAGALIPVAKKIKELQIEYSFRSQIYFDFFGGTWNVYLEINKDGSWIEVGKLLYSKDSSSQRTLGWAQALPPSLKEGSSPHIIKEAQAADPAAELAKYFTTNGNYESIELRLRAAGNLPGSAWGKIHVDYLRIRIIHHDDDVLPIMQKITDSGNTGDVRWVKCSNVTDWTQMGITVDVDAFQIGESTRQIVQDIASESGLNIDIETPYSEEGTLILRPNNDDTDGPWNPSAGADLYAAVDDDVEQPAAGDGVYIAALNSGECILDFSEIEISEFGYASKIELWIYGKQVIAEDTDTLTVAYKFGDTLSDYEAFAVNWNAYTWNSQLWEDLNIPSSDINDLKICLKNASTGAGGLQLDVVYVKITYGKDTWNKYMARKFKGQHCIEPLKAVCKLEGAEWMEDYVNNRIKLVKKADFVSSGVTITQADYDHDWEFEDQCNEVKYIYVWGKTSFDNVAKTTTNIFAKAVSTTASGENSKQITDDQIFTVPEAQEIADEQLALLEVKRPSIKIPLNGINEDIQLGTTVNVTLVRPTVGAADYAIRMIQRFRHGKTGIKTIVHCGFGETKWDEKLKKEIERIGLDARKALTDRLTSTPYDVGIGGVVWGDIGGAVEGVEDVITDEIVGGESIDNAIDALILAHKNIATAHHTAPTTRSSTGIFHSQIAINNGATWDAERVVLDAVNERCMICFDIKDDIDPVSDILMKVSYMRGDAGGGGTDLKLYIAATKTDGSEAIAWNIENGTAIEFVGATNGRFYVYSYTIANAGIAADDTIRIFFNHNEAGRTVKICNVMFQYIKLDA